MSTLTQIRMISLIYISYTHSYTYTLTHIYFTRCARTPFDLFLPAFPLFFSLFLGVH